MTCTWSFRHKWSTWTDEVIKRRWSYIGYMKTSVGVGVSTSGGDDAVAGQRRTCARCGITELRDLGDKIA